MLPVSGIHHVELWVEQFPEAVAEWGWLFGELGWTIFQQWPNGQSWRATDGSYVVLEQSSDLEPGGHRRTAAGLNHLALNASRPVVDLLAAEGAKHGWELMFAERHPHAGGDEHYAAYLANSQGFEVEVVAS